jgi:hypothetical protein
MWVLRRETEMTIQNIKKIRLNEHYESIVTCEHCGLSVTIHAAVCKNAPGTLAIKCPCGIVFHHNFNKRRSARKNTALRGVYIKEANRKKTGDILVENLSLTGVRFRTVFQHDIAVNEPLQIKFVLDDGHRNIICEHVQVRYVRGYQIGARFVNTDTCIATLSAYLMS